MNHFDKMRRNMKHLDQIGVAARRIEKAMDADMTDNQFDSILNDTVTKILDRVERIKADLVADLVQ